MEQYYDIGIIGAGILGTSLAHQLSHLLENKTVAMFDQDFVGNGCSRYAGAILSPINLTSMHQVRSSVSRLKYAGLAELQPNLFRKLQTLYVCSHKRADELKQKDPEATHVAQSQLQSTSKSFGWLQIPEQDRLFKSGDTLWGNVYEVCKYFAKNAINTSLYECCEITEYQKSGSLWELQLADGRQCKVSQLVLAKGAWLQAREQGHELIVNNKKIVAYILDASVLEDSPLIYFYDEGAFLLPIFHDQKWLLSITSQDWGITPDRSSCKANARDLKMAEEILNRYAPLLKDKLKGATVHCDGYLSTRCPEVVMKKSGEVLMGGGSGSGFRYAPWVATAATELLLNGHISIPGTLTSSKQGTL